MDILILDPKLRHLCNEEKAAKRELGAPCAKKLRSRLADLDAASTVSQLVAGRPHPLKGTRQGQFSVDLEGGRRLVFEPAMSQTPRRDDGSVDWSLVNAVRIVYVGDYHD